MLGVPIQKVSEVSGEIYETRLLDPVDTSSGAAWDFTGGLDDACEIIVICDDVSLSGTDSLLIQIGTKSALETTGYISSSNETVGAAATRTNNKTTGFVVAMALASSAFTGHMHLTLIDPATNRWIASHSGRLAASRQVHGGGYKTLSGKIGQLRVTRTGTDSGDSGQVNLLVKKKCRT